MCCATRNSIKNRWETAGNMIPVWTYGAIVKDDLTDSDVPRLATHTPGIMPPPIYHDTLLGIR
jgi:hypothetical protein